MTDKTFDPLQLEQFVSLLATALQARPPSGTNIVEAHITDRLDRLEEKIDAALANYGQVAVHGARLGALSDEVKDLIKSSGINARDIEGLKTWRSILGTLFGLLAAPMAIYFIQQVMR